MRTACKGDCVSTVKCVFFFYIGSYGLMPRSKHANISNALSATDQRDGNEDRKMFAFFYSLLKYSSPCRKREINLEQLSCCPDFCPNLGMWQETVQGLDPKLLPSYPGFCISFHNFTGLEFSSLRKHQGRNL